MKFVTSSSGFLCFCFCSIFVLKGYASAQDARQSLQVFLGGGPGGDKAAHGVVAVGGTPMGELHLLLQLAHLAVGNHHKLLIGGRIQEEGIAVVDTHPPADLWPVALHDA